jgi:hypothetical protein
VDAKPDGNYLFTIDRFLKKKRNNFSHFNGNDSKKGRVAPPSPEPNVVNMISVLDVPPSHDKLTFPLKTLYGKV